jgi:hypothetical protein
MMDRRAFLGTLAGGLLTSPRAADAQPSGKVWHLHDSRNRTENPGLGGSIPSENFSECEFVPRFVFISGTLGITPTHDLR